MAFDVTDVRNTVTADGTTTGASAVGALNTALAAASTARNRLTGGGVMALANTEQVNVGALCFFDAPNMVIRPASGFSGVAVDINNGGVGESHRTSLTVHGKSAYDTGVIDPAGVDATVTMSNAGDVVNHTSHGKANGTPVRFSGGTLPVILTQNVYYYIVNAATNTYQVATAVGGTAIVFAGDSSGTVTAYYGGVIEFSDIALNVTAFQVDGDASAGNHDLYAHGCGLALDLMNETEVGEITLHSSANFQAVREGATGTPDCQGLRIHSKSDHIVYAFSTTADTSVKWGGFVEDRYDLGTSMTALDGIGGTLPQAAVIINCGKDHCVENLRVRGHNGRLFGYVGRSGGSAAIGTAHVTFNNVTGVHMYGTFWQVDGCQELDGLIEIASCHNGRLNYKEGGTTDIGSIPCPTLRFNRVFAGNLSARVYNCNAREGIRFGDTARSLYPIGWRTGVMTVVMRRVSDNAAFKPTTTAVRPTDANAIVVEKCASLYVPCGQIEGNIRLEAGASDAQFEVDPVWLRYYSMSLVSGATGHIHVRGKMTTTEFDSRTVAWANGAVAGTSVTVSCDKLT